MREHIYIVKVKMFEDWVSEKDFLTYLEEFNKHGRNILGVEVVKDLGNNIPFRMLIGKSCPKCGSRRITVKGVRLMGYEEELDTMTGQTIIGSTEYYSIEGGFIEDAECSECGESLTED